MIGTIFAFLAQEGEHVAEAGEPIDDLTPPPAELLIGALAFGVFFFFVWKWVIPAMNKVLEERREQIQGNLEKAEETRQEADRELTEYRSQIAGARDEANRIIEEARQTADQLRADIQAKAEAEAQQTVIRAQEEIRAERDRVFQELRGQVGELAVELAGRVVGAELDEQAHRRLIDEYIDEVGATGKRPDLTVASDAAISGYAAALLAAAEAEGVAERVTDEVFAFARSMESAPALREALTDAALPVERRLALVDELLGQRTHPVTPALVGLVVEAGHARDLGKIAEALAKEAAARREHVLAEVRTAVPLDDAQLERLAAQLSRATGRSVDVKVVVDPSVLGGAVATVGDLVFDGSIRGRLDDAKHHLGAER